MNGRMECFDTTIENFGKLSDVAYTPNSHPRRSNRMLGIAGRKKLVPQRNKLRRKFNDSTLI
jgi:hypothetical protein